MANAWFRLYSEFANDPKVQMLSESDQRRYVMLLCMRCSNGDVTLHDEEVAFQLRVTPEEWSASKARFLAKGLISEDNKPTAWSKRQYASDSSNARVAAHRAKKKQAGNVTATPPDTDSEADTEKSKEPPKPPKGEASPQPDPVPAAAPVIAKPVKPDAMEGFAEFWMRYPKKKSKHDAEKAWAKLKPDAELRALMLLALGSQVRSQDWTKSAGQFIPLPATWINGRRWEDQESPELFDNHHGFNGQRDYKTGLEANGDGSYRF